MAHPPKILPRIDPTFVSIAPLELQSILTHWNYLERYGRSFIHHQQLLLFWFSRAGLPPSLLAILVAGRARTSIPQPSKIPLALMPVLPVDLDSRPLRLHH